MKIIEEREIEIEPAEAELETVLHIIAAIDLDAVPIRLRLIDIAHLITHPIRDEGEVVRDTDARRVARQAHATATLELDE